MLRGYLEDFFSQLEMYEDKEHNAGHKEELFAAILAFIDSPTEASAIAIFRSFFKAYWIGTQQISNPFLSLIDRIKQYEQTSGTTLEMHRDHFVHSVYVFLLGISIYINNDRVRNSFEYYVDDQCKYKDAYATLHEEFFYRWGLASLFHDVGYPLELVLKQAIDYAKVIWSYPQEETGVFQLRMQDDHFFKFTNLPRIEPKAQFIDVFSTKYPHLVFPKEKATELLAANISNAFNIDFHMVLGNLEIFSEQIRSGIFVDHGFYSSIIMLRWYYYLMKDNLWNPAYFYFPVVDSAVAILLHNYYMHSLMKPPFCLAPMRIRQHPTAFLLILCDTLQEWNRVAYGKKSRTLCAPLGVQLSLERESLEMIYLFDCGHIHAQFAKDVELACKNILEIPSLFHRFHILAN